MISRIVVLAVIALGLALAARWLFTGDPAARETLDVDTRFDYVLSDFEAEFFADDGTRRLVAGGPRLQHDPATGTADIAEPVFRIAPDARDWHGRAEHARIDRDNRILDLNGDVSLHRELAGGGRVELVTARLRYDLPARTISSDTRVEMTRPDSRIRAGGLRARTDTDRIELSDHVEGTFRPADPDPAHGG